ncbi:unnamed protein product [Schistosoma margrebowiei]|uniref:Uncharacterized protein n=1 Tax=Schistosoma margrebowiei TaxID=48269 RepID=A0A183LCU8_9TREM|nr:unnamed protein product [Schistosoma margrebowiei]
MKCIKYVATSLGDSTLRALCCDRIVVEISQQGTVNLGFVLLGTRQQGVPVILREVMLPDGFDPMSLCFTIRDVTTELAGPRLTCKIIFNHHLIS